MTIPNIAGLGFIITLAVYLLVIGRPLLLPLLVALILCYLLVQISHFYRKIFHSAIRLPEWATLLLALATFILVLQILTTLLGNSMVEIVNVAPQYQKRFIQLTNDLQTFLGNHAIKLEQLTSHINPGAFLPEVATAISSLASDAGLILIYMLFIMLERKSFATKIRHMFPSIRSYLGFNKLSHRLGDKIKTYIGIKTATSALAGVLTFLTLMICKVDFAAFWGLLFFLLNFIPNIGAIVAVVSVLLMVWIQYTSLTITALIAIPLIGIQFAIGNILEPKLMGRSLNLSPMVILVGLVFWGTVWGIPGMILCVPTMVLVHIVLAHFPRTQPLAILLSADGKIDQ